MLCFYAVYVSADFPYVYLFNFFLCLLDFDVKTPEEVVFGEKLSLGPMNNPSTMNPDGKWPCLWSPQCPKIFRTKHYMRRHVKNYHDKFGTPISSSQPRKKKKTRSTCE